MPIVKVNMTKGKSQDYIDKVSKSIDRALVDAYVMPENDLFQMFNQLEPGSFKFDRNFGVGPRYGHGIVCGWRYGPSVGRS